MPFRSIAVQRFNPDVDREPHWEDFAIDVSGNETVLDALLAIADRVDPTLAFRRTCRSGICGACAAMVDVRPCLLCQQSIGAGTDSAAGLRVQPLAGFKVLRDLVVDMEPFLEEFDRVHGWIVPDPAYQGVLPPSVANALWPATACVLCGICSTGRRDDSIHPAAIVRVLRLANDPRDRLGRARLEGLSPEPGRDFAESLRRLCPKAVDVIGLIE